MDLQAVNQVSDNIDRIVGIVMCKECYQDSVAENYRRLDPEERVVALDMGVGARFRRVGLRRRDFDPMAETPRSKSP